MAIRSGDSNDPDFCTGVLIDDDLALTAAHCLKYPDPNRAIVFGTDATSINAPAIPVYSYETPKTYDPNEPHGINHKNHHDIALVRFCGGLPKNHAPASILPPDQSLIGGTTVSIAGYGIQDNFPQGPHWNWGHLNLASAIFGDPAYAESEIQVRTSSEIHLRKGDSGGPAFYHDGTRLYLLGVDNWGSEDATFEIYASVPTHLKWIEEAAFRLRRANCK